MSLHFDGVNDYCEGTAPVTGDPCTYGGHWRWDNDSDTHERFLTLSDASSASERMSLGVEGTGVPDEQRLNHNDGTTNSNVDYPSAAVDYATPGVWYFAAAVEDGTSRRNYVTDGDFTSVTSTLTFTGNIDTMTIGAVRLSGGRQNFFDGRVFWAFVYDVALTQPEITALGLGYSPLFIRPQSLVSFLPLFRDAVDIIRGETFTVSGATFDDENPPVIMPAPPLIGHNTGVVSGANPKGPLGMPLHGPFGGPIGA